MTSEIDLIADRADEIIHRSRDRHRAVGLRSRAARRQHAWKKFARFFIATGIILLAAGIFGAIIAPLGFLGVMLVGIAILFAGALSAVWPNLPEATPASLVTTDLARLPAQAEMFLETQRPALPAPARTIVDGIGVQLDQLGDQLKLLDPASPAASEVRKLVAEELPALVTGYARVPQSMRSREVDGRRPDDQLVAGLKLIETQIGAMTQQIAQGDLDNLAVRKRYLELKYAPDEGGVDRAGGATN